MGGPEQDFPKEKYDQIWPGRWRDGWVIALLLVLALGIRGGALLQTEVPARDSIGFITYALEFEFKDWQKVIKDHHQHPGFPATVLAVSWPIRWLGGGVNCYTMQLSAQIASSLAGMLLVLPMFFLGKEFFGRAVGFWAALLFQCLPSSGQILSDALSDSLFLCLAATALLWGVRAVRGQSLWPFVLCGLFSGLTYLVRPEGVLVIVATASMLAAMQIVPHWRRSWKKSLACGGVLLAAGLLAGSPYFLVTGGFTNKPTLGVLLEKIEPEAVDARPIDPQAASGAGGPLFAVHIERNTSLESRIFQGIIGISAEFSHAYQYVGWLPVWIALWWCREQFRTKPGIWVAFLLFSLQGALVWWLAVRLGYVSDRHILLLVLCSIFQAVAVAIQIPFRVSYWYRAWIRREAAAVRAQAAARPRLGFIAPCVALLLLLLMTGAGLSKTLRPLHGNRLGHHEAGKWLAKNTRPGDLIEDDHRWAYYYSGRVFLDLYYPGQPVSYTRVTYGVVSRTNQNGKTHAPRFHTDEEMKDRGGWIVYQWPEGVPSDHAQVVLYQLPNR